MMQPTISVYTAVVGRTDLLREPMVRTPGVHYFCGSDRPLPSTSAWQRIEVDPSPGPVVAARRFKILLHRRASTDLYLWHDAAYALTVDPHAFIPPMLRCDLLVFPHPWLRTIRAEADELRRRGLVDGGLLDRQLAAYDRAGFPADRHHASTGFLVRRNDPRTARFNDSWWEEMTRFPHFRDQMSFDYATWRNEMNVGTLDGEYRDNPYAVWDDGTDPRQARLVKRARKALSRVARAGVPA